MTVSWFKFSFWSSLKPSNVVCLVHWQPGRSHIKGAAAVLKMRGAKRLRKPLEVRLFVQATSILTTRCMRAGIAPPEYLFDLAQTASKNMGANEPGWRIFHLQMLLARFRAHISQGVIADLHLILKEALRLDGLCSSISLEGNSIWDFETIHSDLDSDLIMFGHYHVYPNFMAAQVWNGIRTARLALHEIIRKTLLKGFTSQPPVFDMEHTAKFQISTDTLFQLRDVLASIPQHLGFKNPDHAKAKEDSPSEQTSFSPKFPWSNFKSGVYYPTPTSSPLPNGLPLIRSFGGYVLPWLLYVAGNLSIATLMIQQKILKTLRLIGHSMGIQQAFVLADEMENKMVLQDWILYLLRLWSHADYYAPGNTSPACRCPPRSQPQPVKQNGASSNHISTQFLLEVMCHVPLRKTQTRIKHQRRVHDARGAFLILFVPAILI